MGGLMAAYSSYREWRGSTYLCPLVTDKGPEGVAWNCIREGQIEY